MRGFHIGATARSFCMSRRAHPYEREPRDLMNEQKNGRDPRKTSESGASNGRVATRFGLRNLRDHIAKLTKKKNTKSQQVAHECGADEKPRRKTWVKKCKNYLVFTMLVQSCCYLQLKIIINIACLWASFVREQGELSAHTKELSRRLTTLLVVKRARIFFGTNSKTMTTSILEMAIK